MDKNNSKLNSWCNKIQSLLPNLNLFVAVYILVIALLYLCFVIIPELFFKTKLEVPAVVYILLSGTAIVLTTWGEEISILLRRIVFKKPEKTAEIKILDERKIRFLLIFIYFIAIIVFTLASLISHPVFNIDKMDYSIIQSFATYIAYDRLVRNYPTIKSQY